MPEPRKRRVAVDGADHRDHDRREQDEEAPEDGRVDEARHEALEELPLAEHDLGLVLHALRHLAAALDRLAEPYEVGEQLGAAPEEIAADGQRRGERERTGEHYPTRAFRSSAVIAGTISVRSPITA